VTVRTRGALKPCSRCVENTAKQRLLATGYRPLTSVSCQFRDGTLTLQGQLSSYFHKQLAQEAIRGVGSIQMVSNQIEVAA
jgi:hypothetical protein